MMRNKAIFLLNVYGPYNHSPWLTIVSGKSKNLSQEGPLDGRLSFLSAFSMQQLSYLVVDRKSKKDLSILEIGSYDGYLSNFLYRRGYEHLTTLEARKNNIKRGKKLRKVVNMKDEVNHVRGNIEHLPYRLRKRKFDCILFYGVLHHLQNPHIALANCKKLLKPNGKLLLETIVLDDSLLRDDAGEDFEMKDIAYRSEEKKVGFLGIKRESNYFPGSTINQTTVAIPSVSGLELLLSDIGLNIVNKSDGWESTRTTKQLGHRKRVKTLIAICENIPGDESFSKAVEEYENVFCLSMVSKDKVLYLLKALENDTFAEVLQHLVSQSTGPEKEIINSISYSPKPKLVFEYCKNLILEGKTEEGVRLLRELVEEDLCHDWRTVYRSLYLLGTLENSRYLKYARICNPRFPESIVDKIRTNYRFRNGELKIRKFANKNN